MGMVYYASYTMAAKPITLALELHYTMIQFLIKPIICLNSVSDCHNRTKQSSEFRFLIFW